MFKRSSLLIVGLLVLSYSVDIAQCQDSFISWYFRGVAQQNNSVLTFNMGDTLNMLCMGFIDDTEVSFFMTITKGASPPTDITYTDPSYAYELTISDPGTLIYDDFDGIQPGFENFVIVPGSYLASFASGKDYRYVGIAMLRPEDAGTYHCSGLAIYFDGCFDYEWGGTSGGLTIVVNTKEGQAHSSIAKASQAMTYSALILGASKFLF